MQRFRGLTATLAGVAACFAAALPAGAAGFGIFEQGTKAMGMAGAFTAQADDGSAMFHNAAGLAFQRERSFQLGTTLITFSEAEFQGADPFPGANYSAEQEQLVEVPSHFYYVQPIGDSMTFGFGFNTPFGLTTEWENPDEFAGRYVSTLASLRTFDLNPTLAWKAGNFGFGLGAIARASDVELNQRAPLFNPFINRVVDVAALEVTSDFEWGYGFNVGILHKFNNSFSWGLSYRSAVEIDYAGDAAFTQISTGNAGLDALVRANLPVGQTVPVETTIEMPEVASFGIALMLTPDLLVEIDANWTGWSSFDELPFVFPDDPELSTVIPQQFDDAYNYRLGVNWTMSDRWQLRVGYVFDETPQPDEAVSPLLPDSDRNGITLGVGYTGRWNIDTAIMYLPFDERSTSTNHDNFNGTYNTTGVLFGVTLGF